MTRHALSAEVEAASTYIRERYRGPPPRLILTLGSGLGDVVADFVAGVELEYGEIPGFPRPRISGHAGRLRLGRLCGLDVAVLMGREHYYERGHAGAMATPLRALHLLGADALLMTNAVGSLHQTLAPGALVLMSDRINLSGANPLIGDDGAGTPFIDMSEAYDPLARAALLAAARACAIDLTEGVYACFSGPSFETPAEIRAARVLGADTVGMSVVAETIIARHAGMRVAAVSVVTNFAAGISPEPLGHQQTMAAAALAAPRLRAVVDRYLCGLADAP